MEQPGIYEVRGATKSFRYWPERRLLEAVDDKGTRTFVADEERLTIGTAATVMLDVTHDGPTTMLTLLLPRVNFFRGSNEEAVTAIALTTVTRSSIAGPGLVDGALQSYESEKLSGAARRRGPAPFSWGCRDWRASLHGGYAGGLFLVVSGICTVSTSGHTVELRRREPQGVNPTDLLLDLVVTEPEGPAAQVMTDLPVSYEEETSTMFATVTILPDGPTITVRH